MKDSFSHWPWEPAGYSPLNHWLLPAIVQSDGMDDSSFACFHRSTILMAAVFILIISNPHRMEKISFLLSMLRISGLLAAIWFLL